MCATILEYYPSQLNCLLSLVKDTRVEESKVIFFECEIATRNPCVQLPMLAVFSDLQSVTVSMRVQHSTTEQDYVRPW